jgi:Protein of unknown function (DUF3455)
VHRLRIAAVLLANQSLTDRKEITMMRHRTVLIAGLASLIASAGARAQQALPENIEAPGEVAVLTAQGIGAQIYECKADATAKLVWQFREPVATLIVEGKTVGQHYPGPTWELSDGSIIVGKPVGRVAGATANDIPLLKLEVTARRGSGQLSAVTTIRRINTKGGVATGPCGAAGTFLSVPYTSDYVFLKKGS